MASETLRHWVVFNATVDVVHIISGLLAEEEKRDIFGRVYDRLQDAFVEFEVRSEEIRQRVNPMQN